MDIQNYMTSKAKATLGQKYRVVSVRIQAPAQGFETLVMRAAITGVSASNEGMKWYEVVPIAAVVGATQAATGSPGPGHQPVYRSRVHRREKQPDRGQGGAQGVRQAAFKRKPENHRPGFQGGDRQVG